MELIFPPDQNYDCVQCAKGCRHTWRIHTDPHTEAAIANSPLALRVIQETGLDGVFDENPDGGSKLLKRLNGACVFLRPDNLCAVHAELGYDSKPIGCREFPFQPVRTPDGLYVGISYYCTAAKQNHGRPMAVHGPDIQDLLKLFHPPGAGFAPMRITAITQATLEWPVYRRMEELMAEEGSAARAMWTLSELAAGLPPVAVPLELLQDAYRQARPELLARDEVLSIQEQFYVATTLCTLELQDQKARQSATERFMMGEEVELPHTGVTANLATLEQLAARLPDWAGTVLAQYYQALLFRKFLVQKRPILDNLVALHLMPRLFGLYAAMAALKRGGSEIERPDVDYALDESELYLTHTTSDGVDRLLSAFSQAYVEQIPGAVSA